MLDNVELGTAAGTARAGAAMAAMTAKLKVVDFMIRLKYSRMQ